MNKKIIPLAFLLLLVFSMETYALEIPGYEGGIKNEATYQEMIFITGEPILLTGTLTISKKEGDTQDTEKYTYKLTNQDKKAELSRTVSIVKDKTLKGDQKTEIAKITSFKENIEVAGIKYDATDKSYQWSKSDLIQQKPGVTYFAGNWDGRKTYTINKTQGTLTIETKGDVVGYQHHWGATETQKLTHFIQSERNLPAAQGTTKVKWEGTAIVEVVHNRTKDYHYEENTPTQISFRGGYLLAEQEENVLKYSYDLPRLDIDGKVKAQRNVGNNSLSLNTNPKNQRLPSTNFVDLAGHWAEKETLLLASLGALQTESAYFGPSLPMTRGEFARVMAVIMDMKKKETIPVRRSSKDPVEPPKIFVDIAKENPNQAYIEAVYEKGIMQGVGQQMFSPNESLTRSQAITVLIKTLGFEHLAPTPQYATKFRDDGQIPSWAKDAIYVAKEIGLVKGTPEGYVQPNKPLTKVETAMLLNNFIQYLQKDLRYDYRENILNY